MKGLVKTSLDKYLYSYKSEMKGLVQTSLQTVAYPGILFEGGSTNSVEDRRQRERGSGGR